MKKTLEQIIDDFKNKHGDKFDYSRVVYVNIDTPVKIICPKHGLFQSTPYSHIKSKHGCLKCTKKSSSYHHNKFIVCKKNNVNLIHIFEFESVDSWKSVLGAYLDNTKYYTIKFNNLRRTVTYKNKEYKVFGKSYIIKKVLRYC